MKLLKREKTRVLRFCMFFMKSAPTHYKSSIFTVLWKSLFFLLVHILHENSNFTPGKCLLRNYLKSLLFACTSWMTRKHTMKVLIPVFCHWDFCDVFFHAKAVFSYSSIYKPLIWAPLRFPIDARMRSGPPKWAISWCRINNFTV